MAAAGVATLFATGGLKRILRNWFHGLREFLRRQVVAYAHLPVVVFYRFQQPKKHSVDAFLNELSKLISPLNAVQIGANDGLTHDPIVKFIIRDAWHATLVEPHPWVFQHRLSPLHRRNKNVRLVNAALGEKDGSSDLFTLSFSNQRWATGLSSFSRSHFEELWNSGELAARAYKNRCKLPATLQESITAHRVPVHSVATIVAAAKTQPLHLLVVDAEGFDWQAIKLFLNAGVQPKVLLFEATHLGEDEHGEARAIFDQRGFSWRRVEAFYLAASMEFQPLLNRIFPA